MSDFVAFARAHGLRLDYAIPDGRWHRTPTEDKPKRRNGAYLFDGIRGVVKNFATMQDYAAYRDGARAGQIDKTVLRARRAIVEAETRAKHAEARALAEDMLKRAAYMEHPYLVKKGFPKERGLVLDGELLLPMREYGKYQQINSLQRISADGSKLFLHNGKAKGSVLSLGSWVISEKFLCEGYATGLSIKAALNELHRPGEVIVCFSASNLAYVGKNLVKRPRQAAYVIADNDKSGAGAQAAEETGLRWCMPPEVGADANDLHQTKGARALANLIQWMDRQHIKTA